jgi:hypothetical protein
MSAPHTNLDKQRRRHRAPMIGMAAAVLFVALLALAAFVWPGIPLDGQAAPDGEPRPAVEDSAPVDGR